MAWVPSFETQEWELQKPNPAVPVVLLWYCHEITRAACSKADHQEGNRSNKVLAVRPSARPLARPPARPPARPSLPKSNSVLGISWAALEAFGEVLGDPQAGGKGPKNKILLKDIFGSAGACFGTYLDGFGHFLGGFGSLWGAFRRSAGEWQGTKKQVS